MASNQRHGNVAPRDDGPEGTDRYNSQVTNKIDGINELDRLIKRAIEDVGVPQSHLADAQNIISGYVQQFPTFHRKPHNAVEVWGQVWGVSRTTGQGMWLLYVNWNVDRPVQQHGGARMYTHYGFTVKFKRPNTDKRIVGHVFFMKNEPCHYYRNSTELMREVRKGTDHGSLISGGGSSSRPDTGLRIDYAMRVWTHGVDEEIMALCPRGDKQTYEDWIHKPSARWFRNSTNFGGMHPVSAEITQPEIDRARL